MSSEHNQHLTAMQEFTIKRIKYVWDEIIIERIIEKDASALKQFQT